MKNTMKFKGYTARIDYDDADRLFLGHIAGINDIVGFHSDTVEGLRHAFEEAVGDYLEACARIGKSPRKAYSGQVVFRISPEIHRKMAMAAAQEGKSMNQWAEDVLDQATGRNVENMA
ncbi:MAG: type II toxin-antitoxin system HicB family antitoxin [Gemmatimonadota bacterium]|nr:type II toxin-antitoxin system HicB family antitoxin [Gemmatimonadota bacterium]